MKKLLSLVAVFSLWISFSMAQTAVPATKLKKDGTPDKRYSTSKEVKPAVKLKKDGTPDKRYSTAPKDAKTAPAVKPVPATKPAPAVRPVPVKEVKQAPVRTRAQAAPAQDYRPTVDRSLSGPNGEQILTGPRGGKYYINKNGNKTYVKREG